MLGSFVYSNPTKLYFGDNAISFLGEELKNYGPKVMLCYGGGSIKRNGIYDSISLLIAHVPCYTLGCRPDQEAAEVCYNAVFVK